MRRQPVLREAAVEREVGRGGARLGQPDPLHHARGEQRAVPRDRDAVEEAQPVEHDQRLAGTERHAGLPDSGQEAEQAMRGDMAGGRDRLGEAQQRARHAAQRRFGGERPGALPAIDQPLIGHLGDGARGGEAADAPTARHVLFSGDAAARRQRTHLLAQAVGDLAIERHGRGAGWRHAQHPRS